MRQRADGATLACLYLLALLIIPARLIVAFVPITLPPAMMVALFLGIVWFGAHLMDTMSMAKGRNAVRTAVAIFLIIHLMTFARATRRYLPTDELSVADSSMIRILAMVTVAIFICDAVRGRDRLDRMMRVLTACVAVVAFVGLVQFGLGIDLASYVNLPGLRLQENAYAAFESRSIFRRPSGTVNHPIEFGLICAIAVPFAAHFLFQARDRGVHTGRWVLVLVLVGLGAMLSLSRTAIIGLVVAGLVMGIMLPRRRGVPMLAVGTTFFIGASAVVPGLFGTLSGMFSNIEDDPSVQGRTKDYDGAWKEIALHPWLGRGFGTYLPTKNPILDNQYLLTMIENGYLGLFAFAGLFLVSIYAALKARSLTKDENLRGIAACLVCASLISALGAATFDLLSFSVATGLLFVIVGASGALLRITRAEVIAKPIPTPAAGRLQKMRRKQKARPGR